MCLFSVFIEYFTTQKLKLLPFCFSLGTYRNDPKFSDRYAWANSADPDQTAPDLDLHCLPFRLDHLDSTPYGRAT